MAKEWPGSGQTGPDSASRGGGLTSHLTRLILESDLCLADGEIDEARARLSAALASLPLGDKRRGIIRYRLGLVELEAGDYEAALEHFGEARRIYEKAGLEDRTRACVWGKIAAKMGLGDWTGAVQELEGLRHSYEAAGQSDAAQWVSELMLALEPAIVGKKVRRIARARSVAELLPGEGALLDRLLARLTKVNTDDRT
ncbi:MAG: eukaryotic translation initiation factor 3 subunit E [candidate division KSB1 bacterium]|nr:eukaryotic translation initiation factor 3 subunit E [candidate division KSB1 bacterium]